MIYVPDTNILVARLNGNQKVAARLRALRRDDVILAAPVLAELRFGASLSARKQENLKRLDLLAIDMNLHPFDAGAARRFGDLKATLRRHGITLSDFDLAIAATALDLRAVLVSDDRVFHDNPIEGLEVENWLASGG